MTVLSRSMAGTLPRLHFTRLQKYIGIFDEEKNETRHAINSVDDIYEYSDHLKKTVGYYD